MIDRVFVKVEKFLNAVMAFIVFMTKNLLISSAFLGGILLAFPNQFVSALDAIRPIQPENFHRTTLNLLGVSGRKAPQKRAEGGSDLAEIGFSADGEALHEERKDYSALNAMNERRVASLEEEVTHLRGEIRKLKVKYQYGGVEPTTEPTKPNWSWKNMLGNASPEAPSK